jgi:hypothetical protein
MLALYVMGMSESLIKQFYKQSSEAATKENH